MCSTFSFRATPGNDREKSRSPGGLARRFLLPRRGVIRSYPRHRGTQRLRPLTRPRPTMRATAASATCLAPAYSDPCRDRCLPLSLLNAARRPGAETKILLSKTAPEFSHGQGPWPTPPIRSRVSPLTGAHRSRIRQPVQAVFTPAYDPQRLFAQRLTCKRHKPQLSGLAAYSITSVARNRIDRGTARPSALAVLRFTIISNLVGS